MKYLQAHLRPVVLLLHHQVQIQPPLSQIPLVLILHLFKTDYQLNDIFPVEITMKNIEIIGRTGTIPFLEMKIQNSYTLEQGILPYSFHHLLAADFVKYKAAMCQESLTHHCFGKI